MPEKVSDRASRYRRQAEHFQSLAKMEAEPRSRAQLLQLADEYVRLADTGSRKPSANMLGTRVRNAEAAGPAAPVDGRSFRPGSKS